MQHRFIALWDAERERSDEKGLTRRLFFGVPYSEEPGPQIYINDVDRGLEIPAHFHKVDQFQVFFGAEGATFGRQPIAQVLLHYTDAYSTYGPFAAGPDAVLRYATLRAEPSNFGGPMPGARDELLYRGRRHFSIDVPTEGPEGVQSLVAEEPDGLAAWVVAVDPASTLTLPTVARSSGRAYCVVAGSVGVEDANYGVYSLGWSEPDAGPLTLTGGSSGGRVVVMDFPFPATPAAYALARAGADASASQ